MAKIRPCLWFDTQAEEAARFYTGVFPNSEITNVRTYGEAGPGQPGSVMIIEFTLDGAGFLALNGGPANYSFNEAVSFYRECETQDEVDELWATLTEGGEPSQCGWLKDRYGVSWQIVPKVLLRMLADPDPTKASAVMQAMLKMGKIETQELQDAYDAAA
jgi:predicted 3-demethylubiquinone-9 3-methyltransferase (glyoxalase superfamily)